MDNKNKQEQGRKSKIFSGSAETSLGDWHRLDNGYDNLIPRVLSLLRESTLVTAGHVSMHANPSRTEGGSFT